MNMYELFFTMKVKSVNANPAANSNSALECAFYRGYNEIIELLLQYRADPNIIFIKICILF